MKSMMKKTLSVIIALAMILVPMAVSAASGTDTDPATLAVDGTENVCTVEANGHYWYTFTAETDGALSFVPTGDDVWLEFFKGAINMSGYAGGADFPCGSDNPYILNVVADTQYFIDAKTSSMESGTVSFTATFEEGASTAGDSLETAIDVTGQTALSVPANSTKYFYVTGLYQYGGEYTLTVNGGMAAGMGGGITATTFMNGSQVATATGDAEVSVLAVGMMAHGGSVYFSVTNPALYDYETVAFSITDGAPNADGPGAYNDPIALELGDQNVALDGNECWYKWTATEDGTFTLTMNNMLSADGWTYQFDGGSPYSTAWNEYDKNVCEVEVAAGDEVLFGIWVPYWFEEYETYDAYTAGSGTIYFSTSFVAGTSGGGDIGGGDIGGGDIGGDEPLTGDNYILSDEALVVGTKDYPVSPMYQYTLFMFEPTETGKYTITTTDSLIGYLGGGTFYFADPSAENVAYTSYEWECTSVGQGILLGVMANTNTANITITREELDESDELEWTIYENEADVEAFEYEGDTSALVPVDFEDDVIDDAVLGEDGFYHLNTVDGPILYANLNETSLQSLVAIIGNGKLSAVSYAEDGTVLEKVDYTEAVTEYINSAYVDEATGAYYYPLTADLIEMFKEVGASNEWYDGEIWVHDSADAWMFACYYVPAVVDGGNEGGNVPNPEIPNTGAEAFGVAFAMMATAAALGATVVTTKKSKRVK